MQWPASVFRIVGVQAGNPTVNTSPATTVIVRAFAASSWQVECRRESPMKDASELPIIATKR